MGSDLKGFFAVLILLRICEHSASSTFPLALANCKDHCGDVSVLYPFGIGQGCYNNKWFEIVCRNSSEQVSVPFLLSIRQEVISFDFDGRFNHQSNKIRILSPLKHTGCSNGSVGDSSSLNLTDSPFFISDNNRFTAIGCNNKALMEGTGSQIVGCKATCKNETYRNDNALGCVGDKCCQTKIPSGLQVFDATVEKMEPGKDGCQIAYLTHFQLSAFMFTPPELPEYGNYVMMELEWFLDVLPVSSEGSAVVCQRRLKGDQIPGSSGNLSAIDGYHCWCEQGYEGNPYILGGCQGVYKLLSHS